MAEEQDDAQKTEDPTQKKLDDAFEKGEAPKSQEVRAWFMLLAMTIAFALFAGSSASGLKDYLAGFIGHAHEFPLNGSNAAALGRQLGGAVFVAVGLPVLLLIAGGLAGNLAQGKVVFTNEKLKPKLSKISLKSGFKRLFSVQSLAEFGKTLAKFVIVGAVSAYLLWPERGFLVAMISSSPEEVLALVWRLALKLAIAVVAIMTLVAGADFALQKAQFKKRMRMTKQEVKDEHKQLEGDPQVKARIRQVRMERARQRLATAVPEADVVITNPTHFAVALAYKHGQMQVPVLKAKGVDHLARRIRELAREHDIPIVENPPLARAIHAAVEVDQEIPPEHYKAVAEVIGFILRRRGDMTSGGPRPGRPN